MEIFINNEKTSFELENEKNSLDIINAIGDFAEKSDPKHFITSVFINNREYSLDDEKKLMEIKIDEIQNIRVETGDVFGITTITLNQIDNFITILKNVIIQKKNDEILNHLDDSLKWISEGLRQIIKIYNPNDAYVKQEVSDFFENLNCFRNFISGKDVPGFFNNDESTRQSLIFLDIIKTKIRNIKKWLVYSYRLPDREFILNNLSEIVENIEDMIPKLQNIPILFQTGEDREGMNTIQSLTGILEECIGIFVLFKENFVISLDEYNTQEVPFDDFFKSLTTHLKDLMEAIQRNDFVMVGDLLEYEFVPNLEEIKKILIKIKGEAFIKAN